MAAAEKFKTAEPSSTVAGETPAGIADTVHESDEEEVGKQQILNTSVSVSRFLVLRCHIGKPMSDLNLLLDPDEMCGQKYRNYTLNGVNLIMNGLLYCMNE